MNSHTKYQNMNVKCKNINRALHEKNAFRNLTVSSIPTSFTSLSCGLRRNTSLLLHFFILFSYSYALSVTVLTLWVVPKMFYNWRRIYM